MFRKNNKSKNNTYKSFDSWLNSTKESINEFKDETHRELEEENNDKDKKHCFSKKGKCYRKSSDKADIKENFPKSQKTKMSRPIMDKRSYEGKVNSRGSIKASPMMGEEGDPSDPELRKKLEKKRQAYRKAARDKEKNQAFESYKRKSVKNAEKKAQISDFAKSLKDKESFKRAILASEVLGPPLSKRNNH